MTSLWRKRKTSDIVAPFARHDGQKTPKLFTMTATTDNDLSIKSWMGLTPEEIDEIIENSIDKVDALIQTMDKLKEKNT